MSSLQKCVLVKLLLNMIPCSFFGTVHIPAMLRLLHVTTPPPTFCLLTAAVLRLQAALNVWFLSGFLYSWLHMASISTLGISGTQLYQDTEILATC